MLSPDTFSGNVGLAISQSLILTGMVQYGIRQVSEINFYILDRQRK